MLKKRIRSEYMKKFKDPKWETYTKCYEDSLQYRLTRRLLEQTHKPWFWEGCDSDSESSGQSTPQNKKTGDPLEVKEAKPTGSGKDLSLEQEQEGVPRAADPKSGVSEKEENRVEISASKDPTVKAYIFPDGLDALKKDPTTKDKEREPNRKEGACVTHAESEQKGRPAVPPQRSRRVARSKSQPRETKELDKENRHPFAMYGGGEKQAEMAAKRTHNVRPAASTNEIHESALRAKTRREVEKQMKKSGRRRAQSADLEERQKKKTVLDYNPWMTEYMRCFSVRSR